jgi:DNA-binding transcriptional regulator GbsR (MarR family)
LDEIVVRLGVSKGSISLNIRELERWGAVRKIWVPGTRKDYYEDCTDLAGILYARMKQRFERLIEATGPQLQAFLENRELGPLQRDRLANLRETRDLLAAGLKLLPADINAARLSTSVRRLRAIKSVLGGA